MPEEPGGLHPEAGSFGDSHYRHSEGDLLFSPVPSIPDESRLSSLHRSAIQAGSPDEFGRGLRPTG